MRKVLPLLSSLLVSALVVEAFSLPPLLSSRRDSHLLSLYGRLSFPSSPPRILSALPDVSSSSSSASAMVSSLPRGGASITSTSTSLPPTYVLKSSTSSLLHGYDTGVIAGALLYLVPALSLQNSPFTVGLIVTSCTLGAILGSVITPNYLEKEGRVPVLRVSSSAARFIQACMRMAPSSQS